MRERFYHLCNKPSKVFFRNESDFINAITKLASTSYCSETQVMAFSVMSTHFHFVIKSPNIKEFIFQFKRDYTKYFNLKYKRKGAIFNNLNIRELNNAGELLHAINYVLKNPLHHNVVNIPFKYQYSSINVYFREELNRYSFLLSKQRKSLRKTSELSAREYRKLFGHKHVSMEFLIANSGLVIPESFIDIRSVEQLYKTARSFMYNMNKPMTEEINFFGFKSTEVYQNDRDLHTKFSKMDDLAVCEFIDRYLHPKTFVEASQEDYSFLKQELLKRGVDTFQFERCL